MREVFHVEHYAKPEKCSTWNTSSWRLKLYNTAMTAKSKRAKGKKTGLQTGRIARLRASASTEDELFRLAEENADVESRWNRPRKQRISLRVDCEVVDWLKSRGPGYQTRIKRILRRVMVESKKRMGEK
jgi:uncharacterized protein (DUF4415 family)